jgi:mono/diheme cytochrome c family protein
MYVGRNPLPITREVLLRGQQRYNIYCSPCHDRAGEGRGIVAIRTPSWQPTNLQEDRQKQMADGEIFSIISQGRRSMPAYRFQVPAEERWAIVAYVRALQRTTNAKLEDIPQELRESLR